MTPLVPEPVCFRALVYSWGTYKLLKTQFNHHSQGLFQADVNNSKCNKKPMNQLKRTQSLCHTVAVMICKMTLEMIKLSVKSSLDWISKLLLSVIDIVPYNRAKKPNHVQSLANIWPYTEINFQIYCSSQNKIWIWFQLYKVGRQ